MAVAAMSPRSSSAARTPSLGGEVHQGMATTVRIPQNGRRRRTDTKICNNCKYPRENHPYNEDDFANIRERLGLPPTSFAHSKNGVQDRLLNNRYAWMPPGLRPEKVDEYFAQLPNHKVPRLKSPGEKYREKQLILQLPKQDLSLAYCRFLEKEHSKSYDDFVNARNEIALDIAYVKEYSDASVECAKCHGVLVKGDVVVIAPKFGEKIAWHPACFVCISCDELLVDLTHCTKDGKLYCERHYAEQLKPRCSACDEKFNEQMKDVARPSEKCNESFSGERMRAALLNRLFPFTG